MFAQSRQSISRPSSSAYTALSTSISEDVDDDEDDEDAKTLIGSPASLEYVDHKSGRLGGYNEHPLRHSRQSSIQKGNSKTHLEVIDEEELVDVKNWGFWEVCAVAAVRRMLVSLFLLS